LLHTILHRTDLIVFPLTLQTITTTPMMSIWGKGYYHHDHVCVFLNYTYTRSHIGQPRRNCTDTSDVWLILEKVAHNTANDHEGHSECWRHPTGLTSITISNNVSLLHRYYDCCSVCDWMGPQLSPLFSIRTLNMDNTDTMIVSATRRRTMGDHAFPAAAAWNSLPSFVRDEQSLAAFRQQLKTVLFTTSFGEDANTWAASLLTGDCLVFVRWPVTFCAW